MMLNNLKYMSNENSLNIQDVFVCEDTNNFNIITEEYSQVEISAPENCP